MISIIGAGPAGSFAAYSLAKKNFDVEVFEEHPKVGIPIQCSGVITPALDSLLPKIPKSILVNKIKKVKFNSPDGNSFTVKIPVDYVFDRSKLDQYISSLAESAGVKFHLNSRFESLTRSDDKIKFKTNSAYYESDYLVGADGPYSKVGQSSGLLDISKRKFITGMQARTKCDIYSKDTVEIFLGYGEFAWLIPENDEFARVGLVSESNPKNDFDKLMKKTNSKIVCYQSGMIPVYDRKLKTQDKNIYLIGDAAGMVKASSHGGIFYSMSASKYLVDSIINNKNYDSLWKKNLGLDLWLHLQIRNTLKKFSHKNYNDLVDYFSQDKLKNILSENVREYPSKFVAKMLLKEPILLKFGFKLLEYSK